MEASGSPLRFPPLPALQYMLDYFFEIGPTKGEGPIEGPDLVAWQELLGIEWQPWQARLLIRLSKSYLGEMHRARKHDAEPPWPEFKKQWAWVQRQAGDRRLDVFLSGSVPKKKP